LLFFSIFSKIEKQGSEKMKDILTLGIESSCDETSVSVVKNGREILSNIIDTQIPIHEKYGGVVPEIASRNHIEAISGVTKQALEEAKITFEDIDIIACTCGPGLVGALLVGVSYAKALSYALNKPLIGTNHIEGHIAANYITHDTTFFMFNSFRRTYSLSTYKKLQ
jgi:N6-L-threonylcarbamoyladenine synthase